ncbi:uncharacterized protein OGAPODRAFT_92170 [Ogataea polymorpha]|uniref:uncharacterized protein n=1 Tax=Ogataea polymorpha TaxID=460523 RepID=UPI0007F35124|nr:uncharacterized protein OGAPODRAFT_92170 [Ogataea polymorpha]OBA18708.1 hypothetical protein OGAPODRAFT_92170 [Ogataea polymorpha]
MTADINVSTVVNANNAFISFLDHLPCDIVRSLWVTQSLSLKNEEIRNQLDSLLRDQRPGKITNVETLRVVANLKRQLVRNSRELVAEAEQLSQILDRHQRLSSNELHLMDLLKDSRKQQDTRTWEDFTRFKRNFVSTAHDDSDAEDEDPLAQKQELVSTGDGRVRKTIKEKKERKDKIEKNDKQTRISIKLGTESPVEPTPLPPIAVVYNRIAGASSASAVLNTEEFEQRFKSAFKSVWRRYPNYGKVAHMPIDTFWRHVLSTLYGGNYKFVDDIIKHFETRDAYNVFEDVLPFLNSVKASKVQTCIASNADRRVLRLIIDEFGLGNFFKPQDIFLSYDLEISKPDSEFFKLILEQRGMLAKTWRMM